MTFRPGVLLLAIGFCQLDSTSGFLPFQNRQQTLRPQTSQYFHASSRIEKIRRIPSSSTQLFAEETKLWDRMQIEEDEEPMWYVLNCVAGLEIDLLRQCRQRCEDMDDVDKFVVPMVTTTRSHGANRMVKDTKVKYQGYVFAKLRLCPETYTSIQGLDLCRSWMGTINYKGHKKLPPAPLALNEDEIENFGLEDLESEEPEEPEDDVIVDSEEADQEAAEMEETVQTVYRGLRVGDMVKITAKNKFFDEDAIVRRLKGEKVFLRFYTYGSMYEEWMDPGDVRKLSEIEVLKGLSGPQQPITQQDFDGSNDRDGRSRFGDNGREYGDSRRNQVGMKGAGPRNRRQDRTAGRFQRDSDRNGYRNEENWNWYKDNERRKAGSGYQDGEYELRGSQDNNNDRRDRRDDGWAQGDVDSQWGRKSQRQNRREGRQRRQDSSPEDDWSAFVSPVSKKQPTKEETDDFFASLMTDLSNDLEIGDSPQQSSSGSSRSSANTDGEDDFFASLMSEIEEQDTSPPSKDSMSSGSDDDFFASLEEEIRGSPKTTSSKAKGPSSGKELDDFFSELGSFDDSTPANGGADDFFAGLEAELESELSVDSLNRPAPDTNGKKSNSQSKTSSGKSSTSSGSSVDAASLQKLTVPVLKEMLKERGLKVSGKKAELIQRLSTK